jgi:hypothetical protein
MCPHLPYQPNLVSCGFWLFTEIKLTMKGNRFDTIPGIDAATKERQRRWFPELLQKLAGPLE